MHRIMILVSGLAFPATMVGTRAGNPQNLINMNKYIKEKYLLCKCDRQVAPKRSLAGTFDNDGVPRHVQGPL